MKNIFNSISIYILGKNSLVTKYQNQMCYNENKSMLFYVMKNSQIFPLKVSHFQHDYRFLFKRKMWVIRTCQECLEKH